MLTTFTRLFRIMRFIFSVLSFALLCVNSCFAQNDYTWWNQIHHWDGVSSWTNYIKTTPGHLGPNALPVPIVREAVIDTVVRLEVSGEHHVQSGDITDNPYLHLHIPIGKGKAALQLFGRPQEWYQTTTDMRDYRASRGITGSGHNTGDLYVATLLRVLKQHSWLPYITIGATTKTTTGKALENARHTNSPGYCYDLNLGYVFTFSNRSFSSVSINGIIGLYVWQAYQDRQDDAIFYGWSMNARLKHWSINPSFAGYKGYFNQGDRPQVARIGLQYYTSKMSFLAQYQYGIRDQALHTFKLGLSFVLNPSRFITRTLSSK